jgi:anti-sigma B factor antagonist
VKVALSQHPKMPGLAVSSRKVDGITVLAVVGEIDTASAPMLTEKASQALLDRPAALVIDLTGVEFLSSAGLEVLVKTQQEGGDTTKVVVVAEGPATSRPITLTGVDQIVPLYSAVDRAITAVTGMDSL